LLFVPTNKQIIKGAVTVFELGTWRATFGGQTCVCANPILVQDGVYDAFTPAPRRDRRGNEGGRPVRAGCRDRAAH
jgi:hypothetical protein